VETGVPRQKTLQSKLREPKALVNTVKNFIAQALELTVCEKICNCLKFCFVVKLGVIYPPFVNKFKGAILSSFLMCVLQGMVQ